VSNLIEFVAMAQPGVPGWKQEREGFEVASCYIVFGKSERYECGLEMSVDSSGLWIRAGLNLFSGVSILPKFASVL
jgi:hypothetical protein